MTPFRTLTLAAGLLISFGSAAADALTTDSIDRWIESMTAVQEWAAENNIADQELTAGDNGIPDFTQAVGSLGSERQGLERITKKHGFDGAIDWAETSNRVTRAFMAAEMSDQDVDMDRVREQMKQRMQQIEGNAKISDAQKQQMRQQMQAMQQQMTMAQKMTEEVPEADREAVADRQEALKQFFKTQQQ